MFLPPHKQLSTTQDSWSVIQSTGHRLLMELGAGLHRLSRFCDGTVERLTSQRLDTILNLSRGAPWPNFSPIPDLVKYLRTQSLVSVASLNVRQYKARWLERLRPLSPMKEVNALNGDGCVRLNPKYIARGPRGSFSESA